VNGIRTKGKEQILIVIRCTCNSHEVNVQHLL